MKILKTIMIVFVISLIPSVVTAVIVSCFVGVAIAEVSDSQKVATYQGCERGINQYFNDKGLILQNLRFDRNSDFIDSYVEGKYRGWDGESWFTAFILSRGGSFTRTCKCRTYFAQEHLGWEVACY